MRFDPVEFGLLCDGLTFAQVGALTKVMLHLWQRGPLSELDFRRIAKGEADAIRDLLYVHGEGLSLDLVEQARTYGEVRRLQRVKAGEASAAKRSERSTTVERPLNDSPTDVLSMSMSPSVSKSPSVQKKERAISDRIAEFTAEVHRINAERGTLEPDELVKFIAHWTQAGPNDRKFHAEKQQTFGIAGRLVGWAGNVKRYPGKPPDTGSHAATLRTADPNKRITTDWV
jgi:hypothetical protein